ncbi:MAG: hypothetical protein JWO97_592 [Acidobacteria bacterium]|nr:hypothetical protein [Acidobacteriota bacterium]
MSIHSRKSVWLATLTVFFCFANFADAGVQARLGDKAFNALYAARTKAGHVRVANVPLADQVPGTLELDRFEIYAPDSVVVVYGEHGPMRVAPPQITFFRGNVDGDPGSLAFVAITEESIGGFVMTHDRKLFLSSRHGNGPVQREMAGMEVTIEEATPSDDYDAQGTFMCMLDKSELTHPDLMRVISGEYKEQSIVTATATYIANIAVDTDYQLRVKLGSAAAVNTYIANLVAAASTIYHRDLKTDLVLKYQSSYDTATDPFTITPLGNGTGAAGSPDIGDALVQLGQVWHAGASPRNITRSAAMFVSGKTFADVPGASAGVAWVQTLCSGDFASASANVPGGYGGAYGILNGAGGNGTIPNPSANPNYVATTSIFDNNYWTLLAFTHELGHVVQSSHTHCTQLSAPDQGLYGRTYVDNCYSGEGGGCYTNGTAGAVNANVPAEKGTVMSYCHLTTSNPGGYGMATRYTFGQAGEASHTIVDLMKARLNTITPALSAITAPASVTANSTGNIASITAVAGATYAWTITNGTITSVTTANSVTFTAGAAGSVNLKIVVTGANSCGATDNVNVTINAQQNCSNTALPASRTVTPPAQTGQIIAVTSACAWTAVSNSGFISITGGANGNGNGNVTYSIAANLTSLQRSGTMTIAGQTVTITQKPSIRGDMDGDGLVDLIWRNKVTGATRIWLMDANGGMLSSVALPTVADLNYVVGGVGDFDRDGNQDILWRNQATGANIIYYMNGTAVNVSTSFQGAPNVAWRIRSVNDWNHDGWPDVILRNTSTGQNVIWIMAGNSITTTTYLPLVTDQNWELSGTGDSNYDGQEDLYWRNLSNGQAVLWFMNGVGISSSTLLGTISDQNWKLQAVSSFNGDPIADVMWRNYQTGQTAVWAIGGGQVGFTFYLPTEADMNWEIVGPR